MKQPEKIRVAVLYGGRSAEHEVSLRSAANVIQYLDPTQFEVIPIGIDKQGNWFLGKDVFLKSLEFNKVAKLNGEHTWFTPEWISKPTEVQPLTELARDQTTFFDVVFPVVHGPLCEDGTLQGLLELTNLPYVGCGVLSSAVGMDKDVSKRLAMQANIPVPPFLSIKHAQWLKQADNWSQEITNKIGYPLFVKPANTGSSIGITKVKTAAELSTAVNVAFQFDTKIIVEKALDVVELEIAVLEALEEVDPIVSVVGEVRPRHEYYSYDAKYLDENGADLLIPAPVSDALKTEARELAKVLFQTLECEGMARVDLFLDKTSQQIYFNEINTIPGFTQISMYPKLMDASGISYSVLLGHLVQLAIKRHKNKSQLIRTYTG